MENQEWHYLFFSKKERSGTLLLLALVIIFTAIPFLYPWFAPQKIIQPDKEFLEAFNKLQDSAEQMRSSKFVGKQSTENKYNGNKYTKTTPISFTGELFLFNPNNISENDWKKLGVPEKTIKTIMRYRTKGGKFKTANDIEKIWGMPTAIANRLIPFVRIPEPGKNYSATTIPIQSTYKKTHAIDINRSDSAAWEQLPGIGPKLAARIVQFREKLGGFHQIGQVAETYGLPDSSFQRIKPMLNISAPIIRQIPLNSAPLSVLGAHPYIRYALGKRIIAYREQHAAFKSIETLTQLASVSDSLVLKLKPYLSLQ